MQRALTRLVGLVGRCYGEAAAIASRHDVEEDRFLLFLDRRHRCYSRAVVARTTNVRMATTDQPSEHRRSPPWRTSS